MANASPLECMHHWGHLINTPTSDATYSKQVTSDAALGHRGVARVQAYPERVPRIDLIRTHGHHQVRSLDPEMPFKNPPPKEVNIIILRLAVDLGACLAR